VGRVFPMITSRFMWMLVPVQKYKTGIFGDDILWRLFTHYRIHIHKKVPNVTSTRKLGKLTFPEFNLLFNRRNWIWHLWVFQIFRLHSYLIPYFWIQVRVNNFQIILSVYRYKEWLSNYYHEIFSQWPLLLIFKTNRLNWADYELLSDSKLPSF